MRARKSTSCSHYSCVCVEVLTETWAKPSSRERDAPEIQAASDEVVVRNSKSPHGSRVTFTHAEWRDFIEGAKRGEFDLP